MEIIKKYNSLSFTLGILLFFAVVDTKHLFSININALVLQLACALSVGIMVIKIRGFSLAWVFLAIFFIFITISYNLTLNNTNFLNPIFPSILLSIALLSLRLEGVNFALLNKTLSVFCIVFLIFTLYFLFSDLLLNNYSGRSKGYGSGTGHAFLCCILILHFYSMFRYKLISSARFNFLIIIPILMIISLQSRGAILSLLILFFISLIKKKGTHFKPLIFITIIIFGLYFYDNSGILDFAGRFSEATVYDLEQLTSGRYSTQALIVDWILNPTSFSNLILGEGLGGIKLLASDGYQFPHLDLLYVFYDGGLITAILYLILAYNLIIRFDTDGYFTLFFLFSLHTNMIIVPSILLFCWLFSILSNYNFHHDRIEND